MANTLSETVSDETLSSIVQIESTGKPTIKARTSSATGLGQFLDGTWLGVVKRHRPDLLQGRSQADVLELRKDPAISLEMLARFTEDNIAIIGRGATDGDIYLAHFAGAGTAKKLFRADPSAPASTCFSAAAIRANRSILEGKTVGEVRAWAERKMKAAGGKGWVAKFAHVKARKSRVKKSGDDTPVKIEEPFVPLPPARPAEAPSAPAPLPDDPKVQGDPELWHVQRRLDAMNYKSGMLDGKWGGLTGGAITGFINDRHLDVPAPTSMEMFREIQEPLKVAIAKAETERFTRPIAIERSEATPEIVAKSAPEIVPVKQNKLTAIWGGISAFFLMIFNAVAEYFRDAVEWLASIKDFFTDVPGEIWFLLGIGGAVFLWWQARKGEQGITDAVKNGERL